MLKNIVRECWSRFNIKGFQEVSLLEWEGKLASILFLPGCNLRCPFCHANGLVLRPESLKTVPFDEIFSYLISKKGWLDSVVITGGEPTLHGWIFDLIGEIKNIPMKVMLETNGTKPKIVKELIDSKKLDYISMDIKAPLDNDKYKKAAGAGVDVCRIKKTISIITSSGIDYEFRTTVVPGLVSAQDIKDIAKAIKGAKKLCLQQFFPQDTIDPDYSKIKPYSKDALDKMSKIAGEFVSAVIIKNA